MFMFYECNGQRCNNGEVMSSDHHVIGSGFADDVNVINVTATDFHHQSILFRNCPFHLSFRGGSNMFLVKFSVLVMHRENQNDYWWFRDDQCCRCLTSNIVRGEIEFKFPIKNSPSGYPPLFEGLCMVSGAFWINPITVTTSSAIVRDKILEITFADDVWNLKDISNWIWSRIGDFPW